MTALPSLRQLTYLVALADTRNFTEAAQACFVTQSTLSGGLQELERTLGAQLVERTRQRVALTDIGADAVRCDAPATCWRWPATCAIRWRRRRAR